MYVPYQPIISSGVSWRLPQVISELPPTRLMQLEQRLQDILGQAIVVTRGLLIAVIGIEIVSISQMRHWHYASHIFMTA